MYWMCNMCGFRSKDREEIATHSCLAKWQIISDAEGVCECGAEKAKQPRHSHWCPKYEEEGS